MKAIECRVYSHILKKFEDAARRINKVITGTNVLRTMTGVIVRVIARRMSGELLTSCGNGISNLMLFKFVCHERGYDCDGFVEGDDGLFACSGPLCAQDFADLGFTVELHEIEDPLQGHFCGCSASPDLVVMKDPRRVFQSFGWTSSFIHAGNAVMDSLLRSKALSLYYEMSQCPIAGQLARTALHLTTGQALTHVEEHWGHISPRQLQDYPVQPFEPSLVTRCAFEKQFGVTIEGQLAIEKHIREYNLERIAEILPPHPDMLHYSERYIEVT